MCVLNVQAHCYNRFFEVIQDQTELPELVLEEAISQVLLRLFGGGIVDDVSVRFSSNPLMRLQYCTIQIRAQCNCWNFTKFPHTIEKMKLSVRDSFAMLLKELFGTANVDSVTLIPAPLEHETSNYTGWAYQ